ncbi:MAG: hypothetical protein ACRCX2_38525 [Paraclostridium sp.]
MGKQLSKAQRKKRNTKRNRKWCRVDLKQYYQFQSVTVEGRVDKMSETYDGRPTVLIKEVMVNGELGVDHVWIEVPDTAYPHFPLDKQIKFEGAVYAYEGKYYGQYKYALKMLDSWDNVYPKKETKC